MTQAVEINQQFAAQRKYLASYAQKHLPRQMLQYLHIDQNTVPDLETVEIVRCLEDRDHRE